MTVGFQAQPPRDGADASRGGVLLIDGSQDTLDAYATHFRLAGREVRATTDPARGWQLAVTAQPDVIVVDVRLQRGFDGLELARKLGQHPLTSAIPVVVLTGLMFPQQDHLARVAGCAAYLAKPCTPATLLEVIDSADRRSHGAPRGRVGGAP